MPILILLASCGGEHVDPPFTATDETTSATLEIVPKGVSLSPGESLRFQAILLGLDEPHDLMSWSATGGLIDQTGLFNAGPILGGYEVHAEVGTSIGVLSDVSTGLVVPNDDEEETPVIPDTTDPASVLWADGFEGGDFRNWSSIAPSGNAWWSGSGGGGSHIGDGHITREQVRSGEFAWKALIDPSRNSYGLPNKSSLARWSSIEDVREFYISAWYYVPTDFPAVSTLIMQAKASGPRFTPVAFRMDTNRELIVRSAIQRSRTLYRTGVKAPLGRWFNLTGRFVIADSGLMELWLDGEKIASVRTDTKDGDYAYPGIGNYVLGKYYPIKCHIYIDDVMITTAPPW